MKKPDLSKPAIKRFFLLHIEKIVLASALVLFGVYFWSGYNTEIFSDKSPDELSKMADRADTYILKPTAWDDIKEYRKGNADASGIIERAANNIKSADYPFDAVSGIAAMTLAKRTDPAIYGVIEPHAVQFTSAAIAYRADGYRDRFGDFPRVAATVDDKADTGASNNQNKFGADDPADDRGDDEPEEEAIPVVDAGSQVYVVNEQTFPGLIPREHNISNKTSRAEVFNVVVVTGLVDFKQQWSAYNKSFESGIGYVPKRDKPHYQYLQIERRVVNDDGTPKPGDESKWIDRSELISYTVPGFIPPSMHKLPKARFPSAPEVVAPENYDPAITGSIPAFVMFDYKPYVNHPKLAQATRTFPKIDMGDGDNTDEPSDIFSERAKKDAKAGKRGKFSNGGAGMGMGGAGGDDPGSPGLPSGPGGNQDDDSQEIELPDATRIGTDMVDYLKVYNEKQPTADYKLVRFFDLQAEAGKTYQYRMRIWIADPNQNDPSDSFNVLQKTSFDNSADGGLGTTVVATDITAPMLTTDVRLRVNKTSTQTDPNDKDKQIYYVTEMRQSADNAEPTLEKIEVPHRDEATDKGVDPDYLRFARPTTWSDVVTITVAAKQPRVAAGMITLPRAITVGGRKFPNGEPVSELVAAVWANDFGTTMPSKRTVYRGDALDFWSKSYVLHPITHRVHLAVNLDSNAEGPEKYLMPINTGNVVVDSIGGNELALPRTEKKRHNLPSEILIMDQFGNFHVQNDMSDSTSYRNRLLLADSSNMVGRERKAKKEDDDDNEGAGGSGKFGGGDGAGAGLGEGNGG